MKDNIKNIQENNNYILTEVNVEKDDIKEKIRIISSFEEQKRINHLKEVADFYH